MAVYRCPSCSKEFCETLRECPKCYWDRDSAMTLKERIISFPYNVLLIASLCGLLIFSIYGFSFGDVFPKGTGVDGGNNLRGDWGALGDFFGGMLNPIFAFLSLVMLVFTLRLNLKELSLSRRELALTRIEMTKSSEALEEQSDSLKAQSESLQRQNFESTFFHLIALFGQSANSVEALNHGKQGRAAFKLMVEDWKYYLKNNPQIKSYHGLMGDRIRKLQSDLNLYETVQEDMSQNCYLQTLIS